MDNVVYKRPENRVADREVINVLNGGVEFICYGDNEASTYVGLGTCVLLITRVSAETCANVRSISP